MDYHAANDELVNWGRAVHDGWLREFLTYQAPPTSSNYVAPIVAFDESERPRNFINLELAELTERTVIDIGRDDFTSYRVLVYWYPKLMSIFREDVDLTREHKVKMLSRHMRTSYRKAEELLTESVCRYRDRRLQSQAVRLYLSPG
jgi:hypothetical protein